ncbi:MAG TPA: Chromate resistance protein ChrB [Chloroflexota bacterium]|nr:Chromate resistance protein ChrB [Chloroflexota bacterium]
MAVRRKPRAAGRFGPLSWRVLVYRVPTEPASKRVAVWRDLKRLGALYLQQCVCIFPDLPGIAADVQQVADKIPTLGGETFLFEVPRLRSDDEARIIAAFRAQRESEYAEIIEECETKFVKEIEFERFRENYTFEEAEEIEQDLEKIRRWFDRVRERDWFKADRRDEVEAWLAKCQGLLARFEEDVYRRVGGDQPTATSRRGEPDGPPALRPLAPLRPVRSRSRRARALPSRAEQEA